MRTRGRPGASRQASLLLAVCSAAQFMVILDVSIVTVTLPSVRADLDFSVSGLQWVVNGYALTYAGFMMLGGRAADLFGRREVFAGGLLLFAVASLIGGVAQTDEQLVGARAVQGLGAAVIAPASMSIIASTFAEGEERNRALGVWGAMSGAGGAAGVLLGGILTQALSWRWTLLINVPIGILLAAAALRVVARGQRDIAPARSLDLAGGLTVTLGVVVLNYGIVETHTHGWGSARTLLTLALGAALLVAFALIEDRVAAAPLVPLRFFRNRAVSAANAVVFCMAAAAFGMWYFLSLYLQEVLGFDPLEAGFAFLPMTLAIFAVARLASNATGRYGPGAVLTTGMTLLALGMLGLSRVSADGSYVTDVLVPSVIATFGIGLTYVPVAIAATSGVRETESGLASGLVNTSRQVGGSIGLALLATVASHRSDDLRAAVTESVALTGGFRSAFLVSAAFAAIGALVGGTVLWRNGLRRTEAPAREPH